MSALDRLLEPHPVTRGVLQALPPERIAEVEDFVDFIASRAQDRALVALPWLPAPRRLQRCGTIPKTTPTMTFDFGDVVLAPFLSPVRPPARNVPLSLFRAEHTIRRNPTLSSWP
jgi:hypothetical protein